MKKRFFFYLFMCLIFSCKQKSIDEKIQVNSYDASSSNNKSTFFLKFWYNMSKEEFNDVVEILKGDKQIEEIDGKLLFVNDECKLELVPNFEDNFLIEIKLEVNQVIDNYQMTNNLACIYPLFQKKYNLPKLIKKSNIESVLKEKNPYYKPERFYYYENQLLQLPEFFNDNSEDIKFITDLEKFTQTKKVIGTELNDVIQNIEKEYVYLPKSEFVIENDKNVIKINQILISTSSNKYSISLLPEYKQYYSSTSERMLESLNNKSLLEKVKSNSKFRILIHHTVSKVIISYIPIEQWNKAHKMKSKIDIDKIKQNQLEEKRKQEMHAKSYESI